MEASVAIASSLPMVIDYSPTLQYVFMAENSAAAATRRIVLYEFDKLTSQYAWKGFITVNFPVTTAHTIRGLRVLEYFYSTGTVSASSTTVTGTETAWQSAGVAVGSRIGFGTTNRLAVTKWYEVTAIANNGSLTVNTPVTEVVSNAAFVIEELRVALVNTNATVTNGGLFLVKGLHYSLFSQGGTNVPAATTIDNIRATYWLADAATSTLTVGGGLAEDSIESFTQHSLYVLARPAASSAVMYRFNVRKPLLTLVAGRSTEALELITGTAGVTGTISQVNNGCIATAQHGSGNGVKSFYFVTTTRVYRIALSNITQDALNYVSDSMVEIPAGGAATVLAGSLLSSIEYTPSLDAFVINCGLAVRSYVSRYKADGQAFNLNFLSESRQTDQSTANPGAPAYPSLTTSFFVSHVAGGVMHTVRSATTAALNQMYAVPIGAESLLMSQDQSVITPVFSIANLNRLSKVVVDAQTWFGDMVLGVSSEAFNLYYRTSGIDDNSGTWNLLTTGDLSGIRSSNIQFRITFRIFGQTCIPARIRSLTLTYEDNNTDSRFLPSLSHSSMDPVVLGFRLVETFQGGIPNLAIRSYNADTNALVQEDTLENPVHGVWEYSPDGVIWLAMQQANANANGFLIRYRTNALPAGYRLKTTLVQI
jgi:hypothetical protein